MLKVKFISFLLLFPYVALSQHRPLSNFRKLPLPPSTSGPESIAFDSLGEGPYTGISDGRIVKYDRSLSRFIDFAFTAPNRSSASCEGNNDPALGPICGRPLGLGFFKLKNQFFIADAYRGLFRVGRHGGLATLLATSAEGVPFRFLNDLTIDQLTGDVYFTEFSAIFLLSEAIQAIAMNDSTGRLLKFDYKTKQVTVMLRGLSGANGVTLSLDRSYLLVAEFIGKRIIRLGLRGPRALQSVVVATFQGMPDNIRRTSLGDFWVASIVPTSQQFIVPTAIKINGNGKVLRTLPLSEYYNTTSISEFSERGSMFYVGSVEANFVGVFNKV